MAASNTNGNGKKNYYNVSYGKLATKVKEIPENHTEIKEDALKSMTQKVENIDLRNKYVEKTGDFPYVVFYDRLEGTIQSIQKNEFDKGSTLQIEVLDKDNETSYLQCKFYSKYTENILNRLCNIKSLSSEMAFTPYSIPASFEIEGKNINMYNQGVSIRVGGDKVEVKYNKDAPGKMPDTERVMNSEGKEQTSRVKRINFLFDEVTKRLSELEVKAKQPATAEAPVGAQVEEDDDDLPF
jgi:single-stranded DNA-binding protein